MSKSAYSNNNSNAAAKPIDTRYLRCDTCIAAPAPYGEQELGTVMIGEVIYLRTEEGPYTPIGRVIRCGNPACVKTPVVKLWRIASTLDIEPANVYKLIKACRGVPAFKLHELYSGELDAEPIPPSLAEFFRPRFGTPADEQAARPTLFEQAEEEEVPAL